MNLGKLVSLELYSSTCLQDNLYGLNKWGILEAKYSSC